jgi:two-component system LytT family response regulator
MITVFLVEDDPAALMGLRKLLAAYPEVSIIGSEMHLADAKHFLANNKPDLIFLDVQIQGGSGMDLLPLIDGRTQVAFITAHEEYAIDAYEMYAIDYLLKPIRPERLDKTMQRVKNLYLKRELGTNASSPMDNSDTEEILELKLPEMKKNVFIKLSSIVWIESMQNYTQIKVSGQAMPVVIRRSLKEWEATLPPERFVRIGRGVIIQFELLRWTEWRSRDEILLSFEGSNEPLLVGRVAAVKLRQLRAKQGI